MILQSKSDFLTLAKLTKSRHLKREYLRNYRRLWLKEQKNKMRHIDSQSMGA